MCKWWLFGYLGLWASKPRGTPASEKTLSRPKRPIERLTTIEHHQSEPTNAASLGP